MNYSGKTVRLEDGADCILKSPVPEDAKDLLAYLRQTSEETYFMIRYPEEVTKTPAQETEFLKAQLESRHAMMISARIEGELAGNLGINAVADQKKLRHRATLGIAVKKKFWRRGIGNILIGEAIAAAGEMGFLQMELGVYEDNVNAIRLYEKFGFERWGRVKNAFRLKDGTFRDEILMGKILS